MDHTSGTGWIANHLGVFSGRSPGEHIVTDQTLAHVLTDDREHFPNLVAAGAALLAGRALDDDSMTFRFLEEVEPGTIERLKEQEEFLLRIYPAEFAKDPRSRATQSSRSNVIALRHTMKQMYGEAVAWERKAVNTK